MSLSDLAWVYTPQREKNVATNVCTERILKTTSASAQPDQNHYENRPIQTY